MRKRREPLAASPKPYSIAKSLFNMDKMLNKNRIYTKKYFCRNILYILLEKELFGNAWIVWKFRPHLFSFKNYLFFQIYKRTSKKKNLSINWRYWVMIRFWFYPNSLAPRRKLTKVQYQEAFADPHTNSGCLFFIILYLWGGKVYIQSPGAYQN